MSESEFLNVEDVAEAYDSPTLKPSLETTVWTYPLTVWEKSLGIPVYTRFMILELDLLLPYPRVVHNRLRFVT